VFSVRACDSSAEAGVVEQQRDVGFEAVAAGYFGQAIEKERCQGLSGDVFTRRLL
jgi:hypothetical protein